ncbi:hypothetical protein D3C78_1451910 [compost metagenome]
MAYIPIEGYYSRVTFRGSYKGELYSREESAPAAFAEVVNKFTRDAEKIRTGSMSGQVITLVRVRYKDKLQNTHERFFDVSFEQREMPIDLGQALFAVRLDGVRGGMAINAAHASVSVLRDAWENIRRSKAEQPKPWLQYLAWKLFAQSQLDT